MCVLNEAKLQRWKKHDKIAMGFKVLLNEKIKIESVSFFRLTKTLCWQERNCSKSVYATNVLKINKVLSKITKIVNTKIYLCQQVKKYVSFCTEWTLNIIYLFLYSFVFSLYINETFRTNLSSQNA